MITEEFIPLANLWVGHHYPEAEAQFVKALELAGANRRILGAMRGGYDFLLHYACKRRGVAVPPYPVDGGRTPTFAAAAMARADNPFAARMAARAYAEERERAYLSARAVFGNGVARDFVTPTQARALRAAMKLLGLEPEIKP